MARRIGYLRYLERSLPRNSDLDDAMPDGFEAAVREKNPHSAQGDGRAKSTIC
jgi:hypothetical protein